MTAEAGDTGDNVAPTTIDEQPSDDKEKPPNDDEGLCLEYDAIICGTGLVQSIVASALARANKTVLHCDANDHYGELDTVWTFEYLQQLLAADSQERQQPTTEAEETTTDGISLASQGSYHSLQFHSSHTTTHFPVTQVGTEVQTPYGNGKIVCWEQNSDNPQYGNFDVSLTNWTMADKKSPTVHLRLPWDGEKSNDSQDVVSLRTVAAQQILQHQSRSLALDVSPSLLYASGAAVQGLLTSGVAEHLEFKTMEAMFWLQSSESGKAVLERVPCSKGDVFQSSLLPPLDKRRFMKFFQLAMDYATERELQMQPPAAGAAAVTEQTEETTSTQEGTSIAADPNHNEEAVQSLNERQLNQGRSLARPQNKAVSTQELQTLQQCMRDNMHFDTYLSEHPKLSTQLRQLIRYALALEIQKDPTIMSTEQGMTRLCDHLKALGRYGTTAFLVPLYGSGELSQFFCRSAAVYGATYLLRRPPQQVLVKQRKDGTQMVEGIVLGCQSLPNSSTSCEPSTQSSLESKQIRGSHVIIAEDAMLRPKVVPQLRLLRRISILRGRLLSSTPSDEQRAVIVIPPGGTNDYAIHGLVLDETTLVTPCVKDGCTLLHLTTVVDATDTSSTDPRECCLHKAMNVILGSASADVDEIFQVTFSYPLNDDSHQDVPCDAEGLHVVHRPAMSLTVDDAFHQAKQIFASICGPDEEFLAISQNMEEKLKEQLKEAYRGPNASAEEDNEQEVLASAIEMLV